MILWNLKKLKIRLIENKVTEQGFINYLIFQLIATPLLIYLNYEGRYSWFLLPEAFLIILIIIFGTKRCYYINNSFDGEKFHIRFFSLYTVIGIRVFVSMILILYLIEYLSILISREIDILENNLWFNSSTEVISHALVFYYLIRNFKFLKKNNLHNIT